MSTNLVRGSWRFFSRHRWQLWLSILGLSLGTAVIVAVDLANESARRAFALSLDTLTGRATHQITAGGSGFDERFYRDLRIDPGIRGSAPVVEGWLRIHGETFSLLGIDPLAEPMFREITTRASRGLLTEMMTIPGGVVMSAADARRLMLTVGQKIPAEAGGQARAITVIGLLDHTAGVVPEGLLIADITTAQELLGRQGLLDRIDLVLDDIQMRELRDRLPRHLQLQAAESRRGSLEQMTRAFHINLSALGLLAMVVGGFLVYNTMMFSVLQRRSQLAVQRMLGVTGRQLFGHMLLEATVIGVTGALLGLLLGIGLAQGLLKLVTRTINDLYFMLNVSSVYIDPLGLLKGFAVAWGATLLAAAGPALEAARMPPVAVQRRSGLEQHARRATPRLAIMGALLVVVGLGIAFLARQGLLIGFFALFLIILGYSVTIPYLSLRMLDLLAAPGASMPVWWSIAVRGVRAGLSRVGLAIAALAVAVSATVGVGIMIVSFRASVTDWLDLTLQNDIYISSASSVSSRAEGMLDPFWLERIEQLEGVRSLSTGRGVKLDVQGAPTDALILSPSAQTTRGFEMLAGDAAQAWLSFRAGEAVLVSEPLASHRKLKPGDRLKIFSDQGGELTLPVAAVFRDYGSTRGMVVLPRNLYERHWRDRDISAIGLQLTESADIEAIKTRLRRWATDAATAVMIRSNIEIRERSLMIFDRTFAITRVLRLLAIGVAFVGVFSTLMALLLEKRKEYAILRATGATPRQMSLIMLMQTAIIGLLAGLLALPLGWLMSEMLIVVINQRAFGWSMTRVLPPGVLLEAMLVALAAALLAGLYPARRLSRARLADALREE